MLKNGSLLITKATTADSGRYKCTCNNNFAQKKFRNYTVTLSVTDSPLPAENQEKLLSLTDETDIKIKVGETLTLLCAGNTDKIKWVFTPRYSNVPINVEQFKNELKYPNVSVEKHEGIYNCSTENDYQVISPFLLCFLVILDNRRFESIYSKLFVSENSLNYNSFMYFYFRISMFFAIFVGKVC